MTLGFSVIVPTYRRPNALANCLEALTRLDHPRNRLEVIVVEDGGPTSAFEALRSRDFGDLRVTEHEYGWIIFVPGLGAGELEDTDIPEWARPLVSYAVATDCLLINFDQAGDRFDGWTVYDW